MKVQVKRFDKSLPVPSYKTEGAACFDVYSRKDVTIAPQKVEYIPLNVALKIPRGAWVMLVARSSTHKLGLTLINGIGIGDWDFSGDDDEYNAAIFNFTKKEVTVPKGTRIAQMMIMKYEPVEFEEVQNLKDKSRGGFGTTGNK